MKKILCVFLAIVMLTGLTLPVFAQEKDAVKIAMRAAHVSGTVLFIDKAAPDAHFLYLDVSFDKISDYEYIAVKISNNNDVLKFENAHVTDDAVTFKSIVGSGKEAYFIARFNRDYLGTEYQDKYCDGMISFSVEAEGKIELTATAYGIDLEGNRVDLDVEFENVITEIKVKYDASECQQGDVNCDGTVTASDARSALRISAGLDTPADDIRALADFDSNGKVTAADARTILRIAAGLS